MKKILCFYLSLCSLGLAQERNDDHSVDSLYGAPKNSEIIIEMPEVYVEADLPLQHPSPSFYQGTAQMVHEATSSLAKMGEAAVVKMNHIFEVLKGWTRDLWWGEENPLLRP
jgi:hypothetical protein